MLQQGGGARAFFGLNCSCIIAVPRDPVAYEYGIKPNSDKGTYVMAHTGGVVVSEVSRLDRKWS